MTQLTKNTFDNLTDKDFTVKLNDDLNATFSLIEIKSINSHTLAEGQSEPFALLFQSNNENIFEQGTYALGNTELNEVALFLVPIASNDVGVQYEAVFT